MSALLDYLLDLGGVEAAFVCRFILFATPSASEDSHELSPVLHQSP